MVRLAQCPQDDAETEDDAGHQTGTETGAGVDQHVSHIVPGPVIRLGRHPQQFGEQLIDVNQLDSWVDLPPTVSVEI